jgi:glycosyltransferase involved in cell wall biosynthesis
MSTNILIIADGRSPTAQHWIANLQALGYSISLISTFPCNPLDGLDNFFVLPVAFSRLGRSTGPESSALSPQSRKTPTRQLILCFTPALQILRYILGPLTLLKFARPYQKLVKEIKPDLVHALRIPFEGMLGSYTPLDFPFIAATWGNDLTLHAKASPLMRCFTKRCLKRANGFSADTQRDVTLARTWGLPVETPSLVVPGSGGLDLNAILAAPAFDPSAYGLPSTGNFVVNPRGIRPKSVHQEVFFKAIPIILKQRPDTHFICPGLAGNYHAENWVRRLGVQKNTHLLPKLPQPQLWSLMKASQIFVSPSSHDGTPNSLLEAMACGCFPVAGDIESLQEWIQDGSNGFLVDPRSPQSLAGALCQALDNQPLHQKAAEHNLILIRERASQQATQPLIQAFYAQFQKSWGESGDTKPK